LWHLSWLVAAVGCATLPPVPGAGGPRWSQLVATHSVLLSDETEALAQQASARIELLHAGLCQVAFHCDAQLRQPLRVIALHDPGQFEQLYGAEAAGAFSPELVYEPLLVLGGSAQANSTLLNRVLTALIAQQTLGTLPPWLLNGLTSYFETAHFDAAGAFVIGDFVRRHVELLGTRSRLSSAALLTQPPSAADDPLYTASAWLLVHYLQSERRTDFAALLAGIASGQTLALAFHEAFPALSPELLDGLLDRYQHASNYLTQSKQIGLQPSAATVVALNDADVYSLRAEVSASCSPCEASQRERTQRLVAQALQVDPKHVRATILRGQPNAASDLIAAHPESWLSWVHAAYTQPERACSSELRDHLQAIAPDNPHTLSLAASCALQAGEKDQALNLSKRAFSAYPVSPRITLAHARRLHAAGACVELAQLLEHEPASPERAALTSLGECVSRSKP
jgi:tetratricopeptide (TPR) repeat protein